MYNNYFYPHKSRADIKQRAKIRLAQYALKHPNAQPIIISSNKISVTWWGKSWNDNLLRYANMANRMDRGKSYVLNGAVIDLQLENNTIIGVVAGTANYRVVITIDKLHDSVIKNIKNTLKGEIDSIQTLLSGEFPDKFKELFFDKNKGLFPTPNQIHMSCDCPDGADMCKHIAAVLYGVGHLLDSNPLLFFKLRSIDIDKLISSSIKSKVDDFLDKAKKGSTRTIDDEEEVIKLFKLDE